MTPRASLFALLLAFTGLVGCDAISGGDSDAVTGTWTGQVTFVADTLLTEPAVRLTYDMEQSVELRLIHDDGLVHGTVSRSGSGTKVFRNATGEPESSDVASTGVLSHEVYGTFVDGQLHLEVKPRWRDHPTCGTESVPYDSGLFNFDVSGDTGQSQAYIAFLDDGIGSGGDPFTVSIRSDQRLAIDRGASDTPELAAVVQDPADVGLSCAFDGGLLRPTTPDAPAIQVER